MVNGQMVSGQRDACMWMFCGRRHNFKYTAACWLTAALPPAGCWHGCSSARLLSHTAESS